MAKYRYLRKIPGQTSIIASKEIILKMCALCRTHFKKKTNDQLRDLGIWPQRDFRKYGIVVSHPLGPMALKKEEETFDHYGLAQRITALWRADEKSS